MYLLTGQYMSDPGTPDSFYGEAPFPPQTVPQMQADCWRTQPDLSDSWSNADLQVWYSLHTVLIHCTIVPYYSL